MMTVEKLGLIYGKILEMSDLHMQNLNFPGVQEYIMCNYTLFTGVVIQ